MNGVIIDDAIINESTPIVAKIFAAINRAKAAGRARWWLCYLDKATRAKITIDCDLQTPFADPSDAVKAAWRKIVGIT